MLKDVANLALEAGNLIRSIYDSQDFTVEHKKDDSPITRADSEANDLIIKGLAQLSEAVIISEETAMAENYQVPAGAAFWLVDPLDGTRCFIERRDTFVVSIGLIENGEPTLGVIYAPVFEQLYTAQRDRGAFCNGERIHNDRHGFKDLIAFSGSSQHPATQAGGLQNSARVQKFYETFDVRNVKRFGSALKLGRLAQGEADIYPRFGPTYEWDIAAGDAILRESGCKLVDINTRKPMQYNKLGFLNNGFIASRQNLFLENELDRLLP